MTALPQPAQAAAAPLHAWRQQALNTILYAVLVLGGIALLAEIIRSLGLERYDRVLAFSVIYLTMAGITFVRRLGFVVRGGALLLACYGLAINDLVSYSQLGDGNIYLFAFVTLTALLFGVRPAIVALVLSLLTMGGIFWALAADWITPGVVMTLPGLTDPMALFDTWATFLLLIGMIIGALLSLIMRLNQTLQHAADARAQAEQAAREADEARAQAEQQATTLATQRDQLSYTETLLRDMVATLETPTIGLANGILLAPIVGTIDSQRAQTITERLLTDASSQRAETVVIDIAGVQVVDTQVAHALVQTTQALRLLGCTVVLSSVSASVAQTLTRLGIDMGDIHTVSSPRDVLEAVQQRPGATWT
jgi:anti-anti-sigma regulatory factor